MSMRLDVYLVENGYAESRTRAVELIKSGSVTLDGKMITKPAYPVEDASLIDVRSDLVCPYVSRGGLKLKAALDAFDVSVNGLVCADIGASSGGFTDCLLRHGAARVYAVDSGNGQLHPSLLTDPRVISLEGCNARYLSETELPEPIALMVMDVSFISQVKLYDAIVPRLQANGLLLSLIKPQFEVGRGGVGKGGIVKDEKLRKSALQKVVDFGVSAGFSYIGHCVSPIKGGDGNIEYLVHFKKE